MSIAKSTQILYVEDIQLPGEGKRRLLVSYASVGALAVPKYQMRSATFSCVILTMTSCPSGLEAGSSPPDTNRWLSTLPLYWRFSSALLSAGSKVATVKMTYY